MFSKSILALAATLALLMPDLAISQVSMEERFGPGRPPAVVASSSAVDSGYPEQSLAGFEWAINRGVDVLVVGVQKTIDGHYIALRDITLPRTTNVRDVFPDGAASRDPGDMAARMHIVGDYTLEEIKQLRLVGSPEGDHPVPTLNEVLDLLDGRMLAILKLDTYDADSLAALLATRDTESLMLFTWSDKLKLSEFSAATGIGVWDTLSNNDAMAELDKLRDIFGPDLKVVDVDATQITPNLVERATELGVRLCLVGSVEDQALARGEITLWLEALVSPVAAFQTESPDKLMELLGR